MAQTACLRCQGVRPALGTYLHQQVQRHEPGRYAQQQRIEERHAEHQKRDEDEVGKPLRARFRAEPRVLLNRLQGLPTSAGQSRRLAGSQQGAIEMPAFRRGQRLDETDVVTRLRPQEQVLKHGQQGHPCDQGNQGVHGALVHDPVDDQHHRQRHRQAQHLGGDTQIDRERHFRPGQADR